MTGADPLFRPRGIVTLLTDFGTRDGYVGAMKGVMLSRAEHLTLVDLSHDVPPGDIRAAAAILRDAALLFPVGTVHLAVVDPGVGSERAAAVLAIRGHAFVGPDNGLFGSLYAQDAQAVAFRIARADLFRHPVSATFHGRDIFAPVAAALAGATVPMEALGPPLDPVRLPEPEVQRQGLEIQGEVVAIDRFGNLLTNIPAQTWPPGRMLAGWIGGRQIIGLCRFYAEVEDGGLLMLTGSNGCIEIAVRNGSAAQLLAVGSGAKVKIGPVDTVEKAGRLQETVRR